MKMMTTSVRLPKEMIEEIERISKEEGVDKGTLLRKLVAESLNEYRIKKALESYRDGRISLWKAAEIAGITYREALEELRKRNIPFRYDVEDLRADVEWATEL
jgi:predicted HTH domain antitoxin